MKGSALIIFVRNPELGKVKTRLAKTIGDENALLVYKELLSHTFGITKDLICDKYILYQDAINTNDIWENKIFEKRVQKGADLGERMHNAFSDLFKKGYESIVIIGSDCYDLDKQIIVDSFQLLNSHDVVIGPALDGGYYLLGLKKNLPEIFNEMPWSSPLLMNETTKILNELSYTIGFLPSLNDVDEKSDLNKKLVSKSGIMLLI